MQMGDVRQTLSDVSKLNKLTGYKSKTNVSEGVSNFVDWYNEYFKKKFRLKNENQIYRFVKKKNYTENFGFQWNIFSKTQIDNFRTKVSKVRLNKQTNWKKKNLNNKSITLEAGGGAGRFSHAFLNQFSGKLVSVDLSSAVESNRKNNYKFF